ncbi:PREDICTED: pentatricopeptide repeat-containing protein At1g62590-like [Prunus mume]|uniref:Pentatricopeptide repeat-containing protein At1g62590-like n=1 Tax=Prunus mume TaxID=102107 RepID=A0ABM0NQ28_PRUMU|nr:PREDICTED: pentatricopeptide repeat-containing protein At1g62590-like [Prunus mume]
MTAIGVEPNTFTYNCLMEGYCLHRDMNKAKGIFDLMLKKGSIVDVFSYTILINGYCNKRRMKEAMHLFEEMTRKRMIPDTVTYTTLIGGFCKDRRIDDAQNIFSKMKVGGPLPNISTYSVLLDGLGRNGHIDMALKFFGELECSNVDFGISPYNILIDEALLRGMEEKGCSPDSVTYNTIIQRFLLNDELSRAQKLIQEMVAKGFSADDLTTTMIVDLIDEGKLDTDLHPVEKKKSE